VGRAGGLEIQSVEAQKPSLVEAAFSESHIRRSALPLFMAKNARTMFAWLVQELFQQLFCGNHRGLRNFS
jgi:hypothetical protein